MERERGNIRKGSGSDMEGGRIKSWSKEEGLERMGWMKIARQGERDMEKRRGGK